MQICDTFKQKYSTKAFSTTRERGFLIKIASHFLIFDIFKLCKNEFAISHYAAEADGYMVGKK